ncbi:AfsR/SARP family transcriptional regulator [Actinobacteria bacterium YIM 96077]|uniref:AfsR/SARP family transcriptional regulator n=1 Tax=Phytoactinopolyspora halophila TaxID=1981511 RepID=A0A329QJI5_9ACTN|nr:BTAD domain-containing putative transcriptional regulator [Phytoactinopolyspora halophila]AYY12561.1 AfsR/SARP family transcriptional regulator [Actinobacteria bacterium YIM 96077]RAW12535.1 AfsR/SARP family transcriptional regulator [Phytoactinopolyspora halophila]
MRFGVLGTLEVHTDRGEPVRVPELKVRVLLADLLAHRGTVVSADRLIEDLWDAQLPANPRTALQARVSQLRRALDDAEPGARELVVSEGPGYALRVRDDAVDADRVAELLQRARDTDDPRQRAALLDDALALWRGPVFADTADAPFARAAVARLDELWLTIHEERAEAHLAAGSPAELTGQLAALVAEHPLRERLRAALMRALYQAGQPNKALETYRDIDTRLRDELGTEPGPELVAVHHAVLTHDPQLRPAHPSSSDEHLALPATLTPLVGRDNDLARVQRALDGRRLVTLVGPGGVGKTRLALAVAHQVADQSADGVRLVELDQVPTGAGEADVAGAISAACGVRSSATSRVRDPEAWADPVSQLINALRGQDMLLVLDNVEHLVDAVAAMVSRLLSAAPGLRVLTTSREPITLPAETVLPVDPLDVDGSDGTDSAAAVELFTARARTADPDAELDPATVRRLCHRLDGIPLALELAAARVRALGVAGLVERLDDRFALLSRGGRDWGPQRQRTLRATLDWSWELLDDAERAVLRRLAPCIGGCTLEAAEDLATGSDVAPDEVADLVARLVDRSWLVSSGQGQPRRFRMLESIAAYAAEALAVAGEERAARDRHLAHYLAVVEQADAGLRGREQRRWLERLDLESANVRAALDHAVATGAADAALRLVDATEWYWFLRGRANVGIRAATTALSAIGDGVEPPKAASVRAWRSGLALWTNTPDVPVQAVPVAAPPRVRWFNAFAHWALDVATSHVQLSELLTEFRASGDEWGTAAALVTRANVALGTDHLDAALRDAELAGAIFTELGDQWGHLQVATCLALVAEIRGDYDEALHLHTTALRMAEDLDLAAETSGLLAALGRFALVVGDFDTAEAHHRRARELARDQGNPGLVDYAEFGLALTLRRRGDLEGAEALLLDWFGRQHGHGKVDGPFSPLPLIELGFVAEQREDGPGALERQRQGHAQAVLSSSPRTMALALEGLAGAHSLLGASTKAAHLLGAADALRRGLGTPLGPGERGDVDRIRSRVQTALGVEAANAAEAEGAAHPSTELAWDHGKPSRLLWPS